MKSEQPGLAIFLCDRTGNMARPWAEAGYDCICVDVQHSIRRDRQEGRIRFSWGDVRSWRPPSKRKIAFVAAFPPCTHVATSGARDFQAKGGAMLRDALETFDACRSAAAWSGAPYMIENPVGVLSSIPHIGPADYWFHPFQFAGYAPSPEDEAYTKKTGLWTGNGFIMPNPKPLDPILGSKMIDLGPSDDRADERSTKPLGFANAVFLANGSSNEG